MLSIAAVAIAPVPVPGEPVMYGFGPLLPADVTTITPAAAAFVEATADGSSARPNGEPSDMLMTSMSLVDGPVDGLDGDLGRALAAEHADEVEIGLRRNAGADPEVVVGVVESYGPV